ncbi:FKBP-type peptidyl-prolyl cis-trans isomerase [Nitrospira sp. Nam74]
MCCSPIYIWHRACASKAVWIYKDKKHDLERRAYDETNRNIRLALALGIGTANAATLPSQEGPVGEQRVMPAEEHVVTGGANVTIAFTLMVPETNQRIPGVVSEYTAGEEEIIPALDDALMGMKPGEQNRVELRPDEAFGPYDDQKIMEIRRDLLPLQHGQDRSTNCLTVSQ